jgi:hypothetical protein
MKRREFIVADLVILSSDEGGRKTPLMSIAYQGRYRPHLVLQPRGTREAKIGIREGRKQVVDDYLPVSFWAGPDPIPVSQPSPITLLLDYGPDPVYHAVVPGAEFTIREGAKIIAHGKVLRRYAEQSAEPGVAPNGGPTTPSGNSEASEGPPSVT